MNTEEIFTILDKLNNLSNNQKQLLEEVYSYMDCLNLSTKDIHEKISDTLDMLDSTENTIVDSENPSFDLIKEYIEEISTLMEYTNSIVSNQSIADEDITYSLKILLKLSSKINLLINELTKALYNNIQ